MTRAFEDKPATMQKVPLLIGLYGSSGSGKTYSALRLATGMQRVTGGEIMVVDTEAKRALHYSTRFKFRHVEFKAPFGPMDYVAAVHHCVAKGAGVIIIDSCSHEWEGPGGVLEMHDAEVDRLCEKDGGKNAPTWKRESMNFPAWARPKQEHQRFINSLLQVECNFILAFRSKEKIKLLTKAEKEAAKAAGEKVEAVKPLGFMPIGDPSLIYEMTASCLLLPGAGGIPTWTGLEPGERLMTKVPEQFKKLLAKPEPLSEDLGEAMARWAAGADTTAGPAVDLDGLIERYGACEDEVTLRALNEERQRIWASLDKTAKTRAKAAADTAAERVAQKAATSSTSTDDAPEPGSEG
jgi:ABC-type dipeptide/oligopeptide/nickel transport system ATPase subunit